MESVDTTLFVYAKDMVVQCFLADELRPVKESLQAEGWVHTATIHPARWIENLCRVYVIDPHLRPVTRRRSRLRKRS